MRSRLKLLVLGVAGVVALAGCGDEEVGPSNAPETSTDQDGGEQDTGQDAEASDDAEIGASGGSQLTFTATTVGGDDFNAAELAGRPAVFWFWAPWCSTCVAEASHVLELVEEHGNAVSVVGVASLGQPSAMDDFIDLTDTSSLTHLNDELGDVWRHFGITQQSTFALVDDEGVMTFSGFLGPDELADRVAELVG